MDQEKEKIIERAVLTLVGLLALTAILVFLPDASARSVYQPIKQNTSFAMSASASSKART